MDVLYDTNIRDAFAIRKRWGCSIYLTQNIGHATKMRGFKGTQVRCPSSQLLNENFPGVKRPNREDDHSHPSRTKFKKAWSYFLTSPYVFMARCLNLRFYYHKCNLSAYKSDITAVNKKLYPN